jgi:hypothetical protein
MTTTALTLALEALKTEQSLRLGYTHGAHGRLESTADAAIAALTAAIAQAGEPFGYFRAEPFGWTNCAETDDGAIALYEHPAAKASTAAMGWRPIETAKDGPLYMVGWIDPDDGFDRHDIDRLEDGVWQQHADNVEHFRSCAQAGAHGPKEHPPYTHCMGIQPIPSHPHHKGTAMSNREILELAAKAAGVELAWGGPDKDMARCMDTWESWSPLTDDGDAFRLAAACGIAVTPYPVYEWPKHSVIASRKSLEDSQCEVVERYGSDPLSATRRAIVRAAAEVGRGMP